VTINSEGDLAGRFGTVPPCPQVRERYVARGVAGVIQNLMQFFLPKEEEFFHIFHTMSERTHQGALILQQLFKGEDDQESLRDEMQRLEHDVDDLKHECTRRLNSTFVTPITFDRQDIITVADELDNVVDFTRAAVDRTVLYKVRTIPDAAVSLSGVLAEATRSLLEGVAILPKLRDSNAQFVKEVNALENKGDMILKQGLADLFSNEKDAVEIIKWKEIFDYVEEAIDHTEDTANCIEAALVKNS
jgi:hypothetical protein